MRGPTGSRTGRPRQARLTRRGALLCAVLLLFVGGACFTTEFSFTISDPDESGESEVTGIVSNHLDPAYLDAAMQANADYRADLAAVGGSVDEDPFPTTLEGISEYMSGIMTAAQMRDSGMDVVETHDGFVATVTIPLSEALANQESSGNVAITIDESSPPAVRYIFDQSFSGGDSSDPDNDIVASLDEIERYRREGLPPKPQLVIRDGEIIVEGEVDDLALWGSLGERGELAAWYWARIMLATSIPTFSLSIRMPGEVAVHTVNGIPDGIVKDNRVTFVFDEAFFRRHGSGEYHLRMETVYIPGRTPASRNDRDGDGILDDDDACPDQYGPPPDGCPTNVLAMACTPAEPAAYAQVTCVARVPEAHRTDALTFDWYLDGAHQATTTEPTWVWGSAQPGKHEVGVDAVGDGWSDGVTIPLDVSEDRELVATMGYMPDPPVAAKSLILSVVVEGQRPDEALTYRWFLDDNLVSEADAMAWVAITGTHTVQVEVRGEGDRLAVDRRSLTVPPLQPAFQEVTPGADAGFDITYLQCPDGLGSDEALECTVGISREDNKVGVLGVVWFVDGGLAQREDTVGVKATFSLPNPPPGDHTVQVRVIHPETGEAAVRSAIIQVDEGSGGANIPKTASTGAAVGSAATIGAWLWLERWRASMAQQRAEAAARAAELHKAAEERADETLRQDRQRWYDQVGELNRIERQRRAYRQALEEYGDAVAEHLDAIVNLGHLQRDHATLAKRLAELRVEFDVTRWTGFTDGVIEIADIMVDTLTFGTGSLQWLGSVPGGYGKDTVKALLKAAVRQKVHEAYGVPFNEQNLARKLLIDSAGIPTDYLVDPTGATRDKSVPRIIFDLAMPRGINKTLLTQGLESRIDKTELGKVLGENAGKGMGFAVGAGETAATAAVDAADKKAKCRQLRRQIATTLGQVLRREHALPEATEDAHKTAQALGQSARQVAEAVPPTADRGVDTQTAWEALQQR